VLEDVEEKRVDLLSKWSRVKSAHLDVDYSTRIPRATVSGLLPGSSLRFKIRAKNSTGVGSWGLESEIVSTAASVPDPVPHPLIEFIDERHIGVKWSRPPCRGDSVTMYDLCHLVSGHSWESMGNWKTELRTSSTFYCVPNLLPGSSHCFRLRAFNSLGWGNYGPPCPSVKTKPDVPATPQAPKMIKWDGEILTIAWAHKPRENYDNKEDNGSPLLHNEVQRLESQHWEVVGEVRSQDRHFDFREPKPIAHGRKFRVRAVNEVGPSEWSKGSEILSCREIFPAPVVDKKKKKNKNRGRSTTKSV
jgi:hypothetical protein